MVGVRSQYCQRLAVERYSRAYIHMVCPFLHFSATFLLEGECLVFACVATSLHRFIVICFSRKRQEPDSEPEVDSSSDDSSESSGDERREKKRRKRSDKKNTEKKSERARARLQEKYGASQACLSH